MMEATRSGQWEPSQKMRDVRRACAAAFGIDEVVLLGRSRVRPVARARQATYYVLHKVFPALSTPCIGAVMGGRDHSTVIHGCRIVEDRLQDDPELLGRTTAVIGAFGGVCPERVPQAHDSHVRAWLAFRAAKASIGGLPAITADSDLAEFAVPGRVWCGQCDRSVAIGAAARCNSPFCGVRRAA